MTLSYTELVAADYLTAKGRSGYFVSDGVPVAPGFKPAPRKVGTVDWGHVTGGRYSNLPRLERPQDWQAYPYPFIYGQADPSLIDHQNWRLCAVQALGRKEFASLTADHYERDDPMLIEYILRNILPRRGIDAHPSEVLLTLGAQNGLWLAAQVLLGRGGHAVVETPGYSGIRAVLAQTGAAITAVPVDAEGLPPDHIPAGVDVVFTTASHHCPTNATMPVARREALLRAASERNFIVIEDDYEFEMSFLKPVSPSIKSLDSEGRVVHAGSFSKSIFPGLRLGWLVGPEGFIREARALRAQVLRHPPGHMQRTAAYFLSLGHYDALVNRMKTAFRRRRQIGCQPAEGGIKQRFRAENIGVKGRLPVRQPRRCGISRRHGGQTRLGRIGRVDAAQCGEELPTDGSRVLAIGFGFQQAGRCTAWHFAHHEAGGAKAFRALITEHGLRHRNVAAGETLDGAILG